jgi:hypothetical protein
MSSPIALSDLLYEVKATADLLNDESVSDKEIILYINKGFAFEHDTLVMLYSDILAKSVDFTLTGSVYDTSVLDISKVRVVLRKISTDVYVPLDSTSPSEFQPTQVSPAYIFPFNAQRPRYYWMQDTLTISPATAAPGDYRLMYVPCWSNISASFDSNDMLTGSAGSLSASYTANNWHDLGITDAAIRCRNRSDLDVSYLVQQKQVLIDNIQNAAIQRDLSGRTRPVSIKGFGTYDDGGWYY